MTPPAYDVFLSYHRADAEAVAPIRRLLEARGLRTFLDTENLPAGLPWPQALEQALGAVRAVIVFLGPQGLGPWQQKEVNFALARQAAGSGNAPAFRVIPVLLPGGSPETSFLFQNTSVDLRSGTAGNALGRLVQGVAGTGAIPAQPPVVVSPYLGLRAFREEDAAFYAGREWFVRHLVARTVDDKCPVIGIVGPSGSGKSSVVMAGLIPELRKRRPPHPTWDAVVFTPGRYPARSLADALVGLRYPDSAPEEQARRATPLAESLKAGSGAVDSEIARTLRDSGGTDRLLVVLDQFEEWLIHEPLLVPNESGEQRRAREAETRERKRLLEDLLEATALRPATLVLTLRADYYGQAIGYSRGLSDALARGQVNLGPMNETELRMAVEQPARTAGLSFEPGLVERILKDVADQPGALPLLEYLLTSMWSAGTPVLTKAAYEQAGGVAGSIGNAADAVYGSLPKQEQAACRHLFTRLVRVNPAEAEGGDTRQVVKRSELLEGHWAVAHRFVERRLLVMGRDPAAGAETVEVAHEQLIRSWPRLAGWIRDDREFLLWRTRLRVFLANWHGLGGGANGLLQGDELRAGRRWLFKKRQELSPDEQRYILKSSKLRSVIRGTAAALIVAVLSAAAWIGYSESDYAQMRAALASAERRLPEVRDAESRAGAQSAVAEAMAKAGRSQQAGVLLEEALKSSAEVVHHESRILVQLAVADVLTKAGLPERAGRLLEEVRKSAAQITNRTDYASSLAHTYRALVRAQSAAGHSREAEELSGRIWELTAEVQDWGPDVRAAVVRAMAKAGQLEEAQKLAVQIENPESRALALSPVGEAMARAGRPEQAGVLFEEAHKAVAQIGDAAWRAHAQAAIAEAMARAGHFEEAQRTAAQIGDAEWRARAHSAVAEALAKAGRDQQAAETLFKEAQNSVVRIRSIFLRGRTQADVAEALAKAGRYHQASALFGDARKSLAQVNDFSYLLGDYFGYGSERIAAQAALAEKMASAGESYEAATLFDETANAAARIDNLKSRARAQASVAKALAKAGRFKQSRALADGLVAADAIPVYSGIVSTYWDHRK